MVHNDCKFEDLTRLHTGKWYEVGNRCTNDPNEELEITAKFLRRYEAQIYAIGLRNSGLYTEVVVR